MVQLDLGRYVPARAPTLRLSAREYARVYFNSTLVQIYLVFGVIATATLLAVFGLDWRLLTGALGAMVVFPLLEYVIHRFLFHSKLFFRFPLTARIWSYLHYAHHMDPSDPNQIAGPPQFSLPVVVVFGGVEGWLLGGLPGALTGPVVGLFLLILYEYAHGYSHLVTTPQSRYGLIIKRSHMLHHFHNETGNFGISSPVFDIVFRTYYTDASLKDRCPTVRNLGYTPELQAKYPWAEETGASLRGFRSMWQFNYAGVKKNGDREAAAELED